MNSSSTMAMQPIEPLDLSTITMPASTLPNTNPITINSGSGGLFLYANSTSPQWNDTMSISKIQPSGVLVVKGDAEFEGDICIKGKSLAVTLSKIEERLAILHPNKNLEQKWDELKELGRLYRELEKDILEQEKIVEILKR